MGKGSKSLTFVSDKKTKSEIKKQSLQKVKKAKNAIKKEKPKDQQKNDFEELKTLLKLERNLDPEDKMQVDESEKQRKKKMSTKKRKFQQLLKSNPQRDKNPLDLDDLQIQSARKILKDNKILSRGQKKRLKKKSKFINHKIIEAKGIETQKLLKQRNQKKGVQQQQPKSSEDKMEDINQEVIKVPQATNNFGNMSTLLNSIQQVAQKQESVKKKSIQKMKAEEAQKEKERLQKIINLNSFQGNALDSIFQHVSNSINMRNK